MIDFGSSSEQFNTFLYYLVFSYVILYPVFVGLFLHVAGPKYTKKPPLLNRFSSLYQGLYMPKSSCLHQVTVFLARRLLIGISIAFLRSYYFLQLEIFLLTSLIVTCYNIGVRPFDTSVGNYIEIANELLVLLTVYILHGFSYYIDMESDRYNIGWFYIQVVAIIFFLNLVYLCHMLATRIKLWIKMNPHNKYLTKWRNSKLYKWVFSWRKTMQVKPMKEVAEIIKEKDRVARLTSDLVMATIKEGSREEDSQSIVIERNFFTPDHDP